jgi:carbon monoxide dehydrogenase subunit G
MANEALMITEDQPAYTFNCASATAMEKGALCAMTSPITAVAATDGGAFAGIVKTEKIANVGSTVSLYRSGWAKLTSSAAVTIGQTVVMSGSGNKVKPAVAANVGADMVGIALSTTSGDNETLIVDIRPGAQNNAYS